MINPGLAFFKMAVFVLLSLGSTVVAANCEAPATSELQSTPHLHQASANPLQVQFDSGARWDLCWHIDDNAGLVLSRLFYGAPGEISRQVLDSGSIGQILFKYDGEIEAQHLVSTPGLGGVQYRPPNQQQCENGDVLSGIDGQQVCQHKRQINHMTKVRRVASVMRHEVSLKAWSQIGTHTFQQVWRLSEDGEIKPSVVFSGSINRYTTDPRFGVKLDDSTRYAASATLLYNWRLDFNINSTPDNDVIDEIEFPVTVTDVVRRSIDIRNLPTETLRETNRELFRGWRISDADQSSSENGDTGSTTKIGYYLDPQGSGHNYTSRSHNWTQFDFFSTVKNPCENLASDNHLVHNECKKSLDYYTDGESLVNQDVVVWYSMGRHFTPRFEDFPAITATETGFTLIPFDWSARTPFSELEDEAEARQVFISGATLPASGNP